MLTSLRHCKPFGILLSLYSLSGVWGFSDKILQSVKKEGGVYPSNAGSFIKKMPHFHSSNQVKWANPGTNVQSEDHDIRKKNQVLSYAKVKPCARAQFVRSCGELGHVARGHHNGRVMPLHKQSSRDNDDFGIWSLKHVAESYPSSPLKSSFTPALMRSPSIDSWPPGTLKHPNGENVLEVAKPPSKKETKYDRMARQSSLTFFGSYEDYASRRNARPALSTTGYQKGSPKIKVSSPSSFNTKSITTL